LLPVKASTFFPAAKLGKKLHSFTKKRKIFKSGTGERENGRRESCLKSTRMTRMTQIFADRNDGDVRRVIANPQGEAIQTAHLKRNTPHYCNVYFLTMR
jgi:hypothetical protein